MIEQAWAFAVDMVELNICTTHKIICLDRRAIMMDGVSRYQDFKRYLLVADMGDGLFCVGSSVARDVCSTRNIYPLVKCEANS